MTNIQFACKTFSTDQIMKCSFGLSTTELMILKALISEKDRYISTMEITEIIKRDRTTIQRSLTSLTEKDLVLRRQKNADKGGYSYIYAAIDKEQIKTRITEVINSFHKILIQSVESL